MATTISVSEATRRRLMDLKMEEGVRSVDDLLSRLLTQYRRMKFQEASDLFRRRLTERAIRFEDLVE